MINGVDSSELRADPIASNSKKSRPSVQGHCDLQSERLSQPQTNGSSDEPQQLLDDVREAQIIDLEAHDDCNKVLVVEIPKILTEKSSPPPANVSSDIVRQTNKRSQPLHFANTTPPIKRNKASRRESIEESEDELSKDFGQQRWKSTVCPDLGSPKRQKLSRGDILRTHFTNTAKSRALALPAAAAHNAIPDIEVRRAVSGKHFYDGDSDHRGQLLLRQVGNSATLVPVLPKEEGLPLDWMKITLDIITRMDHCKAESRYVHVARPRCNDSEPNFFIELVDERDVTTLLNAARDVEAKTIHNHARPLSHVMSIPSDVLQKRWEKAMSAATTYAASKRATKSRNTDQPSSGTRSSDMTTSTSKTEVQTQTGPRRERIVDKLIQSAAGEENQASGDANDNDVTISLAPTTRRTRRSLPSPVSRAPSPERWTEQNPEWRKRWLQSLIYPPTGRNRTTVDDDDISRLDEGGFLNDNLISFYVRYLQSKFESENPELLSKVYIFSTFFFEKLRSTRGKINYDGVKAWTARVDLFSYNYIVVPVNENAHWYLAVICNAPNAINGMPDDEKHLQGEDISSTGIATISKDMCDVSICDDDAAKSSAKEPVDLGPPASEETLQQPVPAAKGEGPRKIATASYVDPKSPKIITLDSLGAPHPATCRALRAYLMAEAKDKRGVDLVLSPPGMTAKRIPEQDNFCDCGVFVLGYMEEFLKDPDETARKLLQKEPLDWNIRPIHLRIQVRDLLFKLQEEQQERLEKEREEKQTLSTQKKKAAAGARSLGWQPAPPPTPVSEKLSRERSAAPSLPRTPVADDSGRHDVASSSPTKHMPPDDDSVKLVKYPEQDTSIASSIPNDILYSASPSQGRKLVHTIVPDGTKLPQSAPIPSKPSERTTDGGLISTLPRSSSEVEVEILKTTPRRKIRVSVESVDTGKTVFTSPNRITRQRYNAKPDSSPALVQTLRSSQSPPPKTLGARYDGVDHSVDLT
jgi:sentrin-specific protease 7